MLMYKILLLLARALFKLSPYYNKKEEILIELPLLSGWQMGLEPTTFRTTI